MVYGTLEAEPLEKHSQAEPGNEGMGNFILKFSEEFNRCLQKTVFTMLLMPIERLCLQFTMVYAIQLKR
jgi:hypothetical protein